MVKRPYPYFWREQTNQHGVTFTGNECIHWEHATGRFPDHVDPEDVLPASAYHVGQSIEISDYVESWSLRVVVKVQPGPYEVIGFDGKVSQRFPNGYIDYAHPDRPGDHLYHPPLYLIRPAVRTAKDKAGQFSLF